MNDLRIIVADLTSTKMDEVPGTNLTYAAGLNTPGPIGFSLPLEHPKCTRALLAPGERELWVMLDGTRVWGGYLWAARPDMNARTVEFAGADWLSMLDHRHIDVTQTFAATDQTTIAWDLINFTQTKTNGALGFTNGSTASGVPRDRVYYDYERKKILSALQDLAVLDNGFDFEITPDKVFKTYHPYKGVQRPAYVYELGKNIDAPVLNFDAQPVVTELTGVGTGIAEAMTIQVRSDAAGLAQFGLRQDSVSVSDVSDPSMLGDYTQEQLRKTKTTLETAEELHEIPTVDPPFGAVVVGDHVRFRAAQGYVTFDSIKRVVGRQVVLDPSGVLLARIAVDTKLEDNPLIWDHATYGFWDTQNWGY